MNQIESKPFLRVPPFPGARSAGFGAAAGKADLTEDQIDELIETIRHAKVGGDYWAKQPALPEGGYTLIRVVDSAAEVDRAPEGRRTVVWSETSAPNSDVSGPCDPWHVLSGASSMVVDADDELALIAAIHGVPLTIVGEGRFSSLSGGDAASVRAAVRATMANRSYSDPFTGERLDASGAVRLCAFWRDLVDRNRDIRAAFGFAFWKRPTVAPLLWAGEGPVPFASTLNQAKTDGVVAVWKSRTPAYIIAALEGQSAAIVEVEDGFIRSAGLGADCVPPLSIVVDRVGVHFDPSGPSELEELLQAGNFTPDVLERAIDLRRLIVQSGISKYGAGSAPLERRDANRRHVLVPGQVEDDRAVLCCGGPVLTNLDLLERARAQEPGAYIIYKPHPDVEAGHRAGAIPDTDCLAIADEVVRDQPISALIDLVDELHVNSSLAGFEALLRSKPVTTHGMPFYAGWGLTRDLGDVPARRTAKRSLDELVAAVLLLYPRYLDPVTGLPCPPEVLVRRIAEGTPANQGGTVVQLRRLQGRLKKRLAGLGSR